MKLTILLLLITVSVASCECLAGPVKSSDEVVAVVDGMPITYGDIQYDASQPVLSEDNGHVQRTMTPASEIRYNELLTLRHRISRIVGDAVGKRLNISVSDDELSAYANAAVKQTDPKTVLEALRSQADVTDACLAGLQAVYERGIAPDEAYETYVKGKTDTGTWRLILKKGAAKSQREQMAKEILADRSATIESLSSPDRFTKEAKEVKEIIAVIGELSKTSSTAKIYYDSLKWPVTLTSVIHKQPQGMSDLISGWWTFQYTTAKIAIVDHDYDDVLGLIGIAAVPDSVMKIAEKTHARLELRYLQKVVSRRYPSSRYQFTVQPEPSGLYAYLFHDQLMNVNFRDSAHIIADAVQLESAGKKTHAPGTIHYSWPSHFAGINPQLVNCYLIPSSVASVHRLVKEMAAYNELIASSPLIIGPTDILPTAVAKFESDIALRPVVDFSLTQDATSRFAEFTSAHENEVIAMIVDGKILSAPNIVNPVLGGHVQISGTFTSLAEAQLLAAQINVAAAPGQKTTNNEKANPPRYKSPR